MTTLRLPRFVILLIVIGAAGAVESTTNAVNDPARQAEAIKYRR